MNRMRVLMLVPDMPDPIEKIQGGIQSAVLNLLRGFATQPVDVLLVSISSSKIASYKIKMSANVTVQYIPEGPASLSFVNYLFSCPGKIRKIVKEFRPDVIHFEEGMNFLLLRMFIGQYNKHVLTIHGITFAEARLKKHFLQRMKWYQNGIVEWLLLPKHIIHISKYSRQIFLAANKLISPVIFNAVSGRFFDIEKKRETSNQLLFVGAVNNRKNILSLIEVMKALQSEGKNYNLKIVGDFDPTEKYREEVLSFIQQNGLQQSIQFLGWKSQSELEGIYKDIDIVVLPSLQETLPVVIAEAMAAGRVMVSTTVGGIPEMITNNESGFTYSPADPAALQHILAMLYDNSPEIERVGVNARIMAKDKFHADVIASMTNDYYKQILVKPAIPVFPIFNI